MKKNWFWILIAVMILWQPLQPIRTVTADALHTAADLIAR